MPKVQIKEVYKYGQINSTRNNYTVFIPVLGALVKEYDKENPETVIGEHRENTKLTLYNSYGQLCTYNYNNGNVLSDPQLYDDTSINYLLARRYLEKGLPVLIQGVDSIYNIKYTVSSTDYTLKLSFYKDLTVNEVDYKKYQVLDVLDSTGSSVTSLAIKKDDIIYITESTVNDETTYTIYGSVMDDDTPRYDTPDTSEPITTVNSLGDETTDLDTITLKDKNSFNIRFLTLGTFVNASLSQTILSIAKSRVDSVALIDHPLVMDDLAGTAATTYKDVPKYVGQVRDYFESKIAKDNTTDPAVKLSNDTLKYGAGFTPWLNVTLNTKDVNKKLDTYEISVNVPGSFGYLSAFVEDIKTNPEWFAIAGSFRGKIRELIEPLYPYTGADVEVLQARATTQAVDLDGANDNIGIAINPIANVIPFGYMIDGNRTLYDSEVDKTDRVDENGVMVLTYNSFLNIRQLVCAIAKRLITASNKYTFEPNSDITYFNFEAELIDLLDRMKSGQGIRGYKIARLQTNAKARIAAKVTISPIEALEDFSLEIELDDSLEIVE